MKKICGLLCFMAYHLCIGHPGVGIVRDSKGNTYYTDLVHVWKLSPQGKKTIAVHNVHTHELYMDANDNLYGEHLWYNGERLNTWGHYVWCLHGNGGLDTVIRPSEGFLKNYSFVRDDNANMYWAERDTVSAIKKRSADGTITTILKGKFTDIRWMHVSPQGVIYFVDLVDLFKIDTSGKLALIAKNISKNSPAFGMYGGKHSLLGIWTDSKENIYVANFSGQVVKRIAQNGKLEDLVYSTTPWAPTGGLFDKDGNLWLLEYSLSNEARVRKIIPSAFYKGKSTAVVFSNYLLPVSIIAVIMLPVIFLARYLYIKNRKRPS